MPESQCCDITGVLPEVQQRCLEIALVFKKFCEDNDLLFYLCGGGCIGAVRHQGFVPWDDDLDVFMPRPDYERLCVLWPQQMDESRYRLTRSSEDQFDRSQLTAITDEETTFVKERQMDLDIPHGIRLEVLPLDGCPENRLLRAEQLFWGLVFQVFNNQEPPTSKGKLLEWVGRAMLAIFPGWKSRYRVACLAERRMSRYSFSESSLVTELCVRFNYMKNEYPRAWFESAVEMPFCDTMLPVPVGYEEYLTKVFGDYRQLPPRERQVPAHDAVLVDPHRGYREYRGDAYPVKR